MALKSGDEHLICSRRGCVFPARWAVCWSNPKIHHNREKIWLSCEDHRDYFDDYFSYRDFPYRIISMAELKAEEEQARRGIN